MGVRRCIFKILVRSMELFRVAKIFGIFLLACGYFLLREVNIPTRVSDYLLQNSSFNGPNNDLRIFKDPKSLKFYVQQNEVYLNRVKMIKKSCITNTEMYLGKSTDREVKDNINVDYSLNIAVCTIQKVGSKFIKELLGKLSSESNMKNKSKLISLDKYPEEFRFYDADKFMIVREPFARAVSGYVDKLFAPNTVYWNYYGRAVISKVRKNATKHSLKCGHDVTFPEFITYLIMNELTAEVSQRDHHFTPLHEHCRPCQISYDFIGKIESYKEDILFLLNVWNSRYSTNITFGDFESETAESRAKFQSHRLFGMRKSLGKCSSFYNATIRTWRSLQIRGLIPISELFPFDPEFTENKMTENDLFLAAKKAMMAAEDKTLVKAQKDEALVEAFGMLPENDLYDLRRIFLPDCMMFGYDSKPAIIFNRTLLPGKRKKKYFIL